MFERLLMDPQELARQRNGPIAEEHRRYLAHVAVFSLRMWKQPDVLVRILGWFCKWKG